MLREKHKVGEKYVLLYNEQHVIMESLAYYGYSGMDNSTKFDAAVNAVQTQLDKNGTDFDATVSKLVRLS